MHTTPTVRSMTKAEKQQLRLLIEPNLLSGTNWRMGVVILSFIGLAIICVSLTVILVMHGLSQHYASIIVNVTPLIAISVSLLIYYKLLRYWTPLTIINRSKFARDYADAEVHVFQYCAVQALFLLEGKTHDVGIIEELLDTSQHREGFVIDIGRGSLLFLRGEYLVKLVTNQRFPSHAFNVLRLPNAGETLAIETLGSPLEHEEIQVITNIDWDNLPEDFTEIQGRLNVVAEGLRMH